MPIIEMNIRSRKVHSLERLSKRLENNPNLDASALKIEQPSKNPYTACIRKVLNRDTPPVIIVNIIRLIINKVDDLHNINMKNYIFLAAGISLLLALYLWFSGQTDGALFVGLWVPSILSLGTLLKK